MKNLFILLLMLATLAQCKNEATKASDEQQVSTTSAKDKSEAGDLPSWAKNANIYEVNLRQYTLEGTFNSFNGELARLKNMGVDILWFMPIHEVSKTKRKGTLGSYYAVTDYKGVNPEHGTMQDFKNMVDSIHAHDMRIIIDWVPNHTGWDNSWIKDHPEWYTRDKDGNVIDPIDPGTGESWGWTDVADLNYDNKDMRRAMIDAMKFWVSENKIDGFRCDVAHNVPQDFWDEASKELFALGEIYMLAESEVTSHRNSGAFHTTYGWSFHHLMNEIAKGEKGPSDIVSWIKEDGSKFNQGFHMHFTSNHDENSWSGTEFERMGDAHKALAVLSYTFQGIPLVYSGQEEPLTKRLEFFEKDVIPFDSYKYQKFYQTLNNLKHENEALWNGKYGGEIQIIESDKKVFGFEREKNGNRVVCFINLSGETQGVEIQGHYSGIKDVFTGESYHWHEGDKLVIDPWSYIVCSNN